MKLECDFCDREIEGEPKELKSKGWMKYRHTKISSDKELRKITACPEHQIKYFKKIIGAFKRDLGIPDEIWESRLDE